MFSQEGSKKVGKISKEIELPPSEQHERINLILIASAFLLLFNVMVSLIYWSTFMDNEKIPFQKSWTPEKWVTKGNNFIMYNTTNLSQWSTVRPELLKKKILNFLGVKISCHSPFLY